MQREWMTNEIIGLYKIKKTKTSIYRDEKNGFIPKAKRIQRGKYSVRVWEQKDLPELGRCYGFLAPPQTSKVIAFYSPSVKSLKTSLAFNLARILALNGVKTLVIGLDIKASITQLLCEQPALYSLSETKTQHIDLYQLSLGKVKVDDVLHATDITTLNFIYETANLNLVDLQIAANDVAALTEILKGFKKRYQVIIFDNASSWSALVRYSIMLATDIIIPINCDLPTYLTFSNNIQVLFDFKKNHALKNHYFFIPTQIEKNMVSSQIETYFRSHYKNLMLADSLFSTDLKLTKQSVFELYPSKIITENYYTVLKGIWDRVNSTRVI